MSYLILPSSGFDVLEGNHPLTSLCWDLVVSELFKLVSPCFERPHCELLVLFSDCLTCVYSVLPHGNVESIVEQIASRRIRRASEGYRSRGRNATRATAILGQSSRNLFGKKPEIQASISQPAGMTRTIVVRIALSDLMPFLALARRNGKSTGKGKLPETK
jgi:hypothetical protein